MGQPSAGRPPRLLAALHWIALGVAAALLVAVVARVYYVYLGAVPLFLDWQTYANAAERLLAAQPLYAREQVAGPYLLPDVTLRGYAYPPSSAVLFLPFALGNAGLVAWLAINIALLLSGLVAVLRRELGHVSPIALALVLIGLAVIVPRPGGTFMSPFADGVVNANVNVGLAGVVAWAWAMPNRRYWLSLAAAVGGIVKVFPGALALWAVRREGWRALALTAAVGLGLILVTLPLTGVTAWFEFPRVLANAVPSCDGRISFACFIGPLVGHGAAVWLGIGLGAVLLGLSVVVRTELLAFTLLVLGMLAPVSDGHPHYLNFVYVLLVVVTARLVGSRRQRTRPAAGPAAAASEG